MFVSIFSSLIFVSHFFSLSFYSQVLILHESYRGSKLSIVSLTYSTVMQDVFSQERYLLTTIFFKSLNKI